MNLEIPEQAVVVLIGPSGAGKSTWARTHFRSTEILSSDACRALVSDNENDQESTADAFDLLHRILEKRLARGRLTVIDATNVRAEDRKVYVSIARAYHVLPVAVVFNLPEHICHQRNQKRPDRDFGPHVVRRHRREMRQGLSKLNSEGFRRVWTFASEEDVVGSTVQRMPLWNNRRHQHGPFDIIGDIHGCFDELIVLLERLGYSIDRDADRHEGDWSVRPPALVPEDTEKLEGPGDEGGVPDQDQVESTRTAVFLGDLVDRGPKSPAVLRLVRRMVTEGHALCIPGNHDAKLVRKLSGKNVRVSRGLAETLAQLEGESEAFLEEIRTFLDELVSHYVLDEGRLVVAHAGLKAEMQGRASGAVREFCLYGETTGEIDSFGLPVRLDWAKSYRGKAMVVYGHTPVPETSWHNNTINIDTGCVFGGQLSAVRYPEREIVSVPAEKTYAEPARPFLTDGESAPRAMATTDRTLVIDDVLGKRIIDTRLMHNITVRAEQAASALEVMSRFAVDPRWLIYLPPTMSPCETSARPDTLEAPTEAFEHYRSRGLDRVVCQEKHMGSRAIAIVCRDPESARLRFGVDDGSRGIVLTRTGRRFFKDLAMEGGLLDRVDEALTTSGLWEELETSWVCLDAELMPWSAKAGSLIRDQYAAVGTSSRISLAIVNQELNWTLERLGETSDESLKELRDRFARRATSAEAFSAAYQRYCWEVDSLDQIRLASFHLMATENRVHIDKDHLWHMEMLGRLAEADRSRTLIATPHRVVALTDPSSMDAGSSWWEERTGQGSEGMVVKPLAFCSRNRRGILQPALKCRGREYLRIIYGPDYLDALDQLRARNLRGKRSLAVREFALGIEALERFVRGEPLRRVHECVFGILALETEPTDPRL